MNLIAAIIGIALCVLGVVTVKAGYPRAWLFIPVVLMWLYLSLL